MSVLIVVDASVALKWIVTEPGSDEAVDLLHELTAGTVSLTAPEHLLGEVGNGLRRRVAQHALTETDAVLALDAIAELNLDLVAGPDRWRRCLRNALTWGVTTYDALYLSLAVDRDAELVTADERLVEAGQARSLPVRSLTG